jgi:tetratricopeptide (TPR) repeat protein
MRSSKLLVLFLAIGMAFVLGAAEVRAEEDAATRTAKKHNTLAKKLFNLGLFKEAAVEYEKAYKAKPVPAFLFNLAQCYKRMDKVDQLERSIFYFESYLKNEPFSPMREEVEKEIAKLKREIAELRKPKPFYKKWWFWTVVGGAVVTGAAIGITAAMLQPEDEQPVQGTVPPYVYGGI